MLLEFLETCLQSDVVGVNAAGRRAVARNHFEAVLGQQLRHLARIARRIRKRADIGIGVQANDEGHPPRLGGRDRHGKGGKGRGNILEHEVPRNLPPLAAKLDRRPAGP